MLKVAPSLWTFEEDGPRLFSDRSRFWAPRILLAPRRDCIFRRVRLLNDKPAGEKAAAMKAKADTDLAHSEIVIRRDKNGLGAGLWIYQRNNKSSRYLPETLATQAGYDEARLVKCLSGYEGQIWEGSDLIASRWWANTPDDKAWRAFLLSADFSDRLALPQNLKPIIPDYTAKVPILLTDRENLQRTFPARRLFIVAACFFLVCLFYQFGQYGRLHVQESALKSQIEALDATVKDNRALRAEAVSSLVFAENYKIAAVQSDLFDILSVFATVLEPDGAVLRSISVSDEKVDVRITGSLSISEPEFVKIIEAGSTLRDVRVVSRSDANFTVAARFEDFDVPKTEQIQ